MYEGNSYLGGTDFSSLANLPPPPPEKPSKTPEFFDDDDDEDLEEEPKTVGDYFEKDDKETKAEEPDDEETAEIESNENEETDSESDADEEVHTESSGEEDSEAREEAYLEESDDDAETDPNSREITEEEEQTAAVEIIDSHKAETQQEAEVAQTLEDESEAVAADVFLDAAKTEIESGQPVDAALEAAKAKALRELAIEEPSDAETEPDESEPHEATAESDELHTPIDTSEAEEPPEATTPSASTGGAGTTPPTPPIPPIPPSPRGGVLPPFPPGGGGGVPHGPGFGPPFGPPAGGNVLTAPNALASPESGNRRKRGRDLLVGGLVGYMIGRRGGRIRTEAKLLPIQNKLEKEVAALHDKIFWHEASVRSLAHNRAVKNPEAAKQVLEQRKASKNAEPSTTRDTPETVEQKPEVVHTERLGQVAVELGQPKTPEKVRNPEELKPVDLMTVPELLTIAERIEVEQSTLRRLYESNRLDYEGLRRIVRAYLRGERYDQLVRDNLLTPEKYAYPETLSPNGVDVGGAAGGQSSAYQFGQNAQLPQDQASHTLGQNQSFNQVPQPWQVAEDKPTQNFTGVIIAGVVIAILLVIFVFVI